MENTKIQWADATVNFWRGCKKVSEGCKFCYMYRLESKYGADPMEVRRASTPYFNDALYWDEPKMIFTCSMSDFFLEEADDWRNDAWDVIRRTPQHTWQILTKRADRILECLPEDWGEGWSNVWLGVSVESQKFMHRAATLAEIPAKLRFISAEPLLEEIDFLAEINGKRPIDNIQWVILGGESGNTYGNFRYRKSELDWYLRAIADLKSNTDVAVFMKQTGNYLARKLGLKDFHGGKMEEWPNELKIRESPDLSLINLVGK